MTTFVRRGLVVSVIALALTGGSAARGPTARVTPGPSAAVLDASPSLVQTVIDRAFALVGSPSRLGGADPSGFDCSGFVAYVFAQAGIGLPRTVTSLATRGASVPTAYAAPGDLLFFATSSGRASHVAIAVGNGFHFRVSSTDAYGNTAVADVSGAPFQFNAYTVPGVLRRDAFESVSGWTLRGNGRSGRPRRRGSRGIPRRRSGVRGFSVTI